MNKGDNIKNGYKDDLNSLLLLKLKHLKVVICINKKLLFFLQKCKYTPSNLVLS